MKLDLVGISVGQVLSLLLALTGVFTQILARSYNLNVASFMNLINYVLLTIVYGAIWARRRINGSVADAGERNHDEELRGSESDRGVEQDHVYREMSRTVSSVTESRHLFGLEVEWYKYALIALSDVEANYLAVLAYKYTNITSVTLLDCFTIPVVMVLSRIFLMTTYNSRNLLGVVICLLGLGILLTSDVVTKNSETAAPNAPLGDLLAILGSACYGVSNLSQEVMIKKFNRVEFLFMLGFFGTIVCGCQTLLTDLNTLVEFDGWSFPVLLCMLGYAASMFGIATVMSLFLEHYDCVFMNISLLTSDFFAVIAAFFIFKAKLTVIYFGGFFLIVVGVVVYNVNLPRHLKALPYTSVEEATPLESPASDDGPNFEIVEPNGLSFTQV